MEAGSPSAAAAAGPAAAAAVDTSADTDPQQHKTEGAADAAAAPESPERKRKTPPPESDGGAADDASDASSTPAGLEYTQDGSLFTSEIFKLCIRGLDPHMHTSGLKKFVARRSGVDPVKIKKAAGWAHAFVTFRSAADRDAARAKLHGLDHKGSSLDVTLADARRDPMRHPASRKRRKADSGAEGGEGVGGGGGGGGGGGRDRKGSGGGAGAGGVALDSLPEEELAARLCDKATPLHEMPYPDQLRLKKEEVRKKLKEVFRDGGVRYLGWVKQGVRVMHGVPCQLDDVTPSPVTEGYRNKCEFTVGPGPGGLPAVGHLVGTYAEGLLLVVPPTACRHIPPQSKAVASWFQDFVRASPLPHYNRVDHTGFWREIAVRTSSESSGAMVTVKVVRSAADADAVKAEVARLADGLRADGAPDVATLFVANDASRSGAQSAEEGDMELVFGPPVIRERLGAVQFDISPQAFFQVNTPAATELMRVIREACPALTERTTLLDICCGTGTIGLALAGSVARVIGVDVCEEAVVNARANAALNGAANCEYIAGKAESVIRDIMERATSGGGVEAGEAGGAAAGDAAAAAVDVVGIVDPPRAGLHKDVVQHIRRTEGLDRLIYVSCSLGGARANIVDLCRATSKRFRGRPFVVQRAIPVDLFPHTRLCECVLVLERSAE